MPTLLDPDVIVAELGASLKEAGWAFSLNRAGLGWATKRLGLDKRKKTLLTVRIGVKGRGRKHNWAKGELSVRLYRMSLADSDSWGDYNNPFRQRCRELCRDFTPDCVDGLTVPFAEGLTTAQKASAVEFLADSMGQWIDDGEQVAAQVEWLHEEHLRHPLERTASL
jgi:hypothetical protein